MGYGPLWVILRECLLYSLALAPALLYMYNCNCAGTINILRNKMNEIRYLTPISEGAVSKIYQLLDPSPPFCHNVYALVPDLVTPAAPLWHACNCEGTSKHLHSYFY